MKTANASEVVNLSVFMLIFFLMLTISITTIDDYDYLDSILYLIWTFVSAWNAFQHIIVLLKIIRAIIQKHHLS